MSSPPGGGGTTAKPVAQTPFPVIFGSALLAGGLVWLLDATVSRRAASVLALSILGSIAVARNAPARAEEFIRAVAGK